ncbi:unnamed protein product [Musa hybrid cultivar]
MWRSSTRKNPAPPPPSTLPRFPPLPAARRKNRSACELLDLILGFQFWLQVDKFVKYLKYQLDYTVINLDQRTSFLRFCKEMNFPYLNNYDAELAWPLILDNFVEWIREKQC